MKESKIQKYVEDGWIRAKMIFEIAGKPEEHVNKTMKDVADKFEKEKIKLIQMTLHKAVEVSDGVYSTFTEAEFLTARISYLFGFVYDYMPSSVEIIEPDNVSETTANISDILNDIVSKLHQYDNAFKRLFVRNNTLQNELANAGQDKKSGKKKK